MISLVGKVQLDRKNLDWLVVWNMTIIIFFRGVETVKPPVSVEEFSEKSTNLRGVQLAG